MKKRIITIARQFGSGGHTIGQETARRLDVPFYDRNLISKIADESGYDQDFIQSMDEAETMAKSRLAQFLMGRDLKGNSISDYVFEAQKRVIQNIAEEGPCVIVGRCSDQILHDREDVLTVFIYADLEKREERILRRYGATDVPVEKRIEEKDGRRAAHYRFYTGHEWGATENYDLCLNSSGLSVELCVDLLTAIFNGTVPTIGKGI
ncbi:MAG: AAA family ATPase [Anaerovoracaceae bacterium]